MLYPSEPRVWQSQLYSSAHPNLSLKSRSEKVILSQGFEGVKFLTNYETFFSGKSLRNNFVSEVIFQGSMESQTQSSKLAP